MGWLTASGDAPTLLSNVSVPPYALHAIGSRHLLVAGGGGAAATGVLNELQLYLLHYNALSREGPYEALRGIKTNSLPTGKSATMNMDLVALGSGESGRFLIAAGQDNYLVVYETTGYYASPAGTTAAPSLSFSFVEVARVRSVEGSKSYQTCVRLDHSQAKPLRVATGTTDGFVRIWDASGFLENRDPTIPRRPLIEFHVSKGDVTAVDFSFCGSLLTTVAEDVGIWNVGQGKRISSLPEVPSLPTAKFRCRTIRFVNINPSSPNAFLIAAHNSRLRDKHQKCFLVFWVWDREKSVFRSLDVAFVANDSISNLVISPCQNFVAVGTQGGSVGVYTTRDFQKLYFHREAHKSFVTAIEFIPRRTLDVPSMGRILPPNKASQQAAKTFLPGVTSDTLASVASMSIDQQLLLHSVPFPKDDSLSWSLLKTALSTLLVYLVLWIVFVA